MLGRDYNVDVLRFTRNQKSTRDEFIGKVDWKNYAWFHGKLNESSSINKQKRLMLEPRGLVKAHNKH